jgi:RsiW-degrading membrane proteinase PrsW (M82 family)
MGNIEAIIHNPDMKEKIFFLLSGIIISIPFTFFFETLAGSLSGIVSKFYASLWATAIVAPIVEEFAKAYPLFYRHGETKRSIISLGFLVGLGFGIAEYFLYVFAYGADVFLRLPGVLFHAANCSIVAYGIATKRPFYFYIIAVFLHFANNFTSLFGSIWLITGAYSIVLTYILSAYLYKRISR